MDDFTVPGPSDIFFFIEERPDSIDNGLFVLAPTGYPDHPAEWGWANFPAYYHGHGANLSFADGHVEFHPWRDARTIPPYAPNDYVYNVFSALTPNNPDVLWVNSHGTARR
jgi:prepilin-type processing-associated H-X9-DG protein